MIERKAKEMYASAMSSSLVLRECFKRVVSFSDMVSPFVFLQGPSVARRGLAGELTRAFVHHGGGGFELKADAEQPIVESLAAHDRGEERHRLDVRFAARERDLELLALRNRHRVNHAHAGDRQVLEDDFDRRADARAIAA